MHLEGKQTVRQISQQTGLSESTVKRRLSAVSIEWSQPIVRGSGVVHIDATYFGRNSGVIVALEAGSGQLLYMRHIAHEHISDYQDAVRHISAHGYRIEGIVIDGHRKLFDVLS